jgi:glycosyltransferase involved in cell wall biosynthesis
MLAHIRPNAHFLLCGANVTRDNQALAALIDSLGLTHRCRLLGARHDVARINAALDVATSSSLSEAFPLALGEAMSCGIPCVATDVGDSALIVGPAGRIVPTANPEALAQAWETLLALPPTERTTLSRLARIRILEHFDIENVTRRYERLYETQVSARSRAKRRLQAVYPLLPQAACVT